MPYKDRSQQRAGRKKDPAARMEEALQARKNILLDKMKELPPETVEGHDTSGDSASNFLGFSKYVSGNNSDEDNGNSINFQMKKKNLRRKVETRREMLAEGVTSESEREIRQVRRVHGNSPPGKQRWISKAFRDALMDMHGENPYYYDGEVPRRVINFHPTPKCNDRINYYSSDDSTTGIVLKRAKKDQNGNGINHEEDAGSQNDHRSDNVCRNAASVEEEVNENEAQRSGGEEEQFYAGEEDDGHADCEEEDDDDDDAEAGPHTPTVDSGAEDDAEAGPHTPTADSGGGEDDAEARPHTPTADSGGEDDAVMSHVSGHSVYGDGEYAQTLLSEDSHSEADNNLPGLQNDPVGTHSIQQENDDDGEDSEARLEALQNLVRNLSDADDRNSNAISTDEGQEDNYENGLPAGQSSSSDTDAGYTFDVNPLSRDYVARSVAQKFHQVVARHSIADGAAADLWELFKEMAPERERRKYRSYRTIRDRHYKKLPPILMDISYEDTQTGDFVLMEKKLSFPKNKFKRNPHWKLRYVVTYVSVRDILRIVCSLHPEMLGQAAYHATLSDDGVPESKSTTRSIDVLSIKFYPCALVFPLKIVRSEPGVKVPVSVTWPPILDEIIELHITVDNFCADAKKRAEILCQKQHNGYYSCSYCYARGEPASTTAVYPHYTTQSNLRTDDDVRGIMDQIEDLPAPVRLGYHGASPLCVLPNFDLTRQVPAEYLHLACLGVVRNLLRWCFQNRLSTGNRTDFTARLETLEKNIRAIKVPSEFSRRTRQHLDLPNLKGSECRNYGCFYFLVVANAFTNSAKLRHLWTLTGFLLRMYILPEDDFRYCLHEMRHAPQALQKRWYILMQDIFGESKMFYNYHVFGAHAHLVRRRGPFTDTSTFYQEHQYGVIQRKFAAGRMSTGKQIFQRLLVDLLMKKHSDEVVPDYSGKVKAKSDDSWLQLESGEWLSFINYEDILEEEEVGSQEKIFRAHPVETEEFHSRDAPYLKFRLVHVYTIKSINTDVVRRYNTSDPGCKIKHKGIRAGDQIMSVPHGVFQEEL